MMRRTEEKNSVSGAASGIDPVRVPRCCRNCPGAEEEHVELEAALSTVAFGVVRINKYDNEISNEINTCFNSCMSAFWSNNMCITEIISHSQQSLDLFR